MERFLLLLLINIPLQSTESEEKNSVDRIDDNAWCQTSSSITIQALTALDELAETVVPPSIFEMKTITACPTRYNFAQTKAVESRATGIKSEYVRKVKRIDQVFAPNVTEDSTDGASGPFQNAYNTFCRGGVIPLVIGAYGETNEDFQEVLKVCARMAVARGDAVYNSPIFETEVKGGAYSVTLHLYRRAIAGAIARGLSLHKRSRLHFVRGSRGEAARVAEEAKNHFGTGRCSDGDGFSARHSSREYGYYEQFRGFRSGPERRYE